MNRPYFYLLNFWLWVLVNSTANFLAVGLILSVLGATRPPFFTYSLILGFFLEIWRRENEPHRWL